MNKEKLIIWICIISFGVVGIYLTFFAGDTSKYDSQTKAYYIYLNESSDSDGTYYYPVYYYKVDGREYKCNSKGSGTPDEDEKTVYYDSKNPSRCLTEHDKSVSKPFGIICLVATLIIVYFFVIKKPSDSESYVNEERDMERQYEINSEEAEKIMGVVGKVQLIYKRVILGIVMAILVVLILLDTSIFKQTIIARNYIETTATLVEKKEESESSIFDDYIYTFIDKEEKKQEIIISVSRNNTPEQEIKIKYNERNPQDYYEEGATMDKSGIIWYIVKIIALVLLIILFFNKKLLNKINVSASNN